MTEVGPLAVNARSAAHAEYLIRSRAEQRRVSLTGLDVAEGSGGMWFVTIQTDSAEAAAAAQLADDTQVLHFDHHLRKG